MIDTKDRPFGQYFELINLKKQLAEATDDQDVKRIQAQIDFLASDLSDHIKR